MTHSNFKALHIYICFFLSFVIYHIRVSRFRKQKRLTKTKCFSIKIKSNKKIYEILLILNTHTHTHFNNIEIFWFGIVMSNTELTLHSSDPLIELQMDIQPSQQHR